MQILVDMPSLKCRVKGLLFLGTPHRGTPFTQFGIVVAWLLTPLYADLDIMRPLISDSVYLDDLEKRFSRDFRNTARFYYYETYRMRCYILGFIPWQEFVRESQPKYLRLS